MESNVNERYPHARPLRIKVVEVTVQPSLSPFGYRFATSNVIIDDLHYTLKLDPYIFMPNGEVRKVHPWKDSSREEEQTCTFRYATIHKGIAYCEASFPTWALDCVLEEYKRDNPEPFGLFGVKETRRKEKEEYEYVCKQLALLGFKNVEDAYGKVRIEYVHGFGLQVELL
jgi:hypothetical protein